MNWPALFRWAAYEFGWTPEQVLRLTAYQLRILQGAIGPDEHYVTLDYGEYVSRRALRR